MSKTNSHTVDVIKFQEYLKVRYANETVLRKHYIQDDFRKIRWFKYRCKQKSESKLVKNIKKKFGPNPILAYGSWFRTTQMKGLIPSPVRGIKRFLSRHFDLITVPEHLTTKTCCKCMTGEMCEVKKRECPRCVSINNKPKREEKQNARKKKKKIPIQEESILIVSPKV